jgi:spore germination protein
VAVIGRLRARTGRWGWAGLVVAGTLLMAAAAPVAARESQPARASQGYAALLPPLPTVSPTPAAAKPLRWAYMVGSKLPDSLRDHAGQIDIISPAWFHADAKGMIYGSDSPAVTQFAKSRGIKVVPIVANGEFQQSVSHALVTDGGRQTQLLDSLQWLVNTFGYDGVNVDFENLAPADRSLFSAMMSNVYARLHPLGKLVTLAIPSKTSERFDGFPGGFDYAGLAPNLDLAIVMAYDQHYSGGSAGPIADIAWVNDVISYAKTAIPPSKIVLGVPFYGYDWAIGRSGARAMAYNDVVSTVFAHGAQIRLDPASQSPYFTYAGRIVWFEDSSSLRAKLNLVTLHGLAGWAGWRLGQEDPNFWTLSLQP